MVWLPIRDARHHPLCSPFWFLVFWEQVYVRIFLFRWDNQHHIPPSPNFVADSDRDMTPISVAHWIKCGLVRPSSPSSQSLVSCRCRQSVGPRTQARDRSRRHWGYLGSLHADTISLPS
ncbi:hypothetical protein CCUS01_01206 [Colletotrichum cuscutae]|uniref:Uncharacterized protein n=1 Tax=Colletotrichum cuscutae TaxID=1209917 RepID=A0AAI9XWB9_9PEZI|nr:hypothetical protein CCUS01_01206 [Colletotrichum cuscutae]